jgi:hypothetical protein
MLSLGASKSDERVSISSLATANRYTDKIEMIERIRPGRSKTAKEDDQPGVNMSQAFDIP